MNSDAGESIPDVPRPWWRCPAALTAFHAQRAFFGFAMAWPLARWVGGAMKGRPGNDATLFDDGGVLLAEALRVIAPDARPLIGASIVVTLVAFVVGHAALAGLIDALARPSRIGLGGRLAATASAVPHLLLLSLPSLIVASGVFGIVWWTGRSVVREVFEAPASRDLGGLAVLLAGVGVASGVGVFQDLVAAGLVGHRLGFVAALDLAWRTLRGRIVGLWLHRAIRSAGAAAGLGAAALAAIHVGMRGSRDAAMAQLLLEASLVAATCLRASWLGIACEALHERAAESSTFRSVLRDEESSSKNPPAAAPR